MVVHHAIVALLTAWLLTCATPAAAQTFTTQSSPVLSPQPGIPFASRSIGAPAVAYDSIRDRFLMAFESLTPNTDPDCPQGIWALGLAASDDGVDWTVLGTPMVLPSPGSSTYYSCVAAHPAAVFNPAGNGSLYVLFKAEEDESSCASSPYPTCPYTGIGRVRVAFNAGGGVSSVNISSTPVLTLNGPGGHPSFVLNNGTFAMLYQRYPDLYRTSSSNINSFSNGALTFDASAAWGDDPSDTAAGNGWVHDEFKSPSVLCDDSKLFPFAAWVGSVDTNFGTVLQGAWGKAISTTGVSWNLASTASTSWEDNDDWRHWDMLRLVTGDYLVWYSKKNGSGVSEIYFGGTTLSFNNSDVESRICN